MEAEDATRIYQRPEERWKLGYIPYVGDGDSKSYTKVRNATPYGPAVFIDKEECIAHVTKKMGSNLRAFMKKYSRKPQHMEKKGVFTFPPLNILVVDNISGGAANDLFLPEVSALKSNQLLVICTSPSFGSLAP